MYVPYVGTWLIFGIVLVPVYGVLLAWFLGKPRNPRLALLGTGYLVGLIVLLWGGLFTVSMLFRVAFFQSANLPATPTPAPAPASAPAPTPPLSPTPLVTATQATGGAEIYARACAACHGTHRQGVPGLAPALTPESLARLTDAEIRDTILKGRPGTAMAGFEGRLSAAEIDALVELIKSTPLATHSPSPAPSPTLTPTPTATPTPTPTPSPSPVATPTPSPSPSPTLTPTASPAPATNGAEIYARTCMMCHGTQRQGMPGLAPALTPESLAKLTDDEVRNVILKGRPGTAMLGFEGRLSAAEINALVELIKRTSP
ncbi:MAG: cytochrome c [Chloroflexi bacterium]|nr:cytochrome c [Chloroflexota bacterium]